MARTDLTVQKLAGDGISPSYTGATTDGHSFDLGTKRVFAHAKNTDTSSHTVTFVTSATVQGLAVADRVVTVPAGDEQMIGPFPSSVFGGSVNVDFSATTGMSLGVFELPNA